MKSLTVIFLFFFPTLLSCNSLKVYRIAFIDISNDVRYKKWGVHPVDIRSKFNKEKRAIAGARLAIEDSKKLQRLTKINFILEYFSFNEINDLELFLNKGKEKVFNAIILDLDFENIKKIEKSIIDNKNIIFFNISEPDNNLRLDFCRKNFFNTHPSNSMLTDATAQYLIEKKWKKVLMLTGPLKQDKDISLSFKESAVKFGLKIINEKYFVNSNDPRVRDKNDLSFLTEGRKYQSIFISDTDGEFSLSVPNASQKPAIVSGSSGLIPVAWHWSYLRHGAPQLNGRFERLSNRRMESKDWAAWISVKALVQATLRIKRLNSDEIIKFFLSDNLQLDGSKGIGLNFKYNTNQLRQPILLISSDNWVTANVPLESFKNRSNNLDTIGIASDKTKCN